MELKCSVEELKLLYKSFDLKEEALEARTGADMPQCRFPDPSVQLIRHTCENCPPSFKLI